MFLISMLSSALFTSVLCRYSRGTSIQWTLSKPLTNCPDFWMYNLWTGILRFEGHLNVTLWPKTAEMVSASSLSPSQTHKTETDRRRQSSFLPVMSSPSLPFRTEARSSKGWERGSSFPLACLSLAFLIVCVLACVVSYDVGVTLEIDFVLVSVLVHCYHRVWEYLLFYLIVQYLLLLGHFFENF